MKQIQYGQQITPYDIIEPKLIIYMKKNLHGPSWEFHFCVNQGKGYIVGWIWEAPFGQVEPN